MQKTVAAFGIAAIVNFFWPVDNTIITQKTKQAPYVIEKFFDDDRDGRLDRILYRSDILLTTYWISISHIPFLKYPLFHENTLEFEIQFSDEPQEQLDDLQEMMLGCCGPRLPYVELYNRKTVFAKHCQRTYERLCKKKE